MSFRQLLRNLRHASEFAGRNASFILKDDHWTPMNPESILDAPALLWHLMFSPRDYPPGTIIEVRLPEGEGKG